MIVKTLIKPSEYHDSVTLMLVARELTKFPGVIDVGVIMATEANKALLRESGLLTSEAQSANPNDLVWIEGSLRVQGDARLAAGRLEWRSEQGLDASTPTWIGRSGDDVFRRIEIVLRTVPSVRLSLRPESPAVRAVQIRISPQ